MKIFQKIFAGACAIAALMATTAPIQATTVAAGFDLLETQAGTTFLGIPFDGVPLGTFNFGGAIGTQPVGPTDTIVQRLAPAVVAIPPGDATIPIELVALHLVSAVPFDPGAGTDFYYVTLQAERGGPPSPGSMTIHFADANGGTFDSFFDVFFDLRKGALDGPIVFSDDLQLTSSGVPWDRDPPPGAILIEGANYHLDGRDSAEDFFPIGQFTEGHPVAQHVVTTAVPEPTMLLVFGLGLIGLMARRPRRGA